MTPETVEKWENILADIEKHKIPVQFIKKVIIKLEGKRQQSMNIQRLLDQGISYDQVEEAISRKLYDLDDKVVSAEFLLDVQSIADTVQPETNRLLGKL